LFPIAFCAVDKYQQCLPSHSCRDLLQKMEPERSGDTHWEKSSLMQRFKLNACSATWQI